ncbi:MAG: hypothetical protein AAGA10_09795 [Bacteroidota bacterium]
MSQLSNISGIQAVKNQLSDLKEKGIIQSWELPYEEILTKLSAGIFFLSPTNESNLTMIWESLRKLDQLQYKRNEERKLSQLEWQIQFKRN